MESFCFAAAVDRLFKHFKGSIFELLISMIRELSSDSESTKMLMSMLIVSSLKAFLKLRLGQSAFDFIKNQH